MSNIHAIGTAALSVAMLSACIQDPVYVQPTAVLEVGNIDPATDTPTALIELPIRGELVRETEARTERAMELGVAPGDIPLVTRDDLEISIEWTITNLSDSDGVARIDLNGANEYVEYVPALLVIDPDEDPEPPPLAGDIPLNVAAGSTLSGVFREDQLLEAAIDLELMGRAEPALSAFAATLQHNEDVTEFVRAGVTMPSEIFASMRRFDLLLEADRHMTMSFVVRVRDNRRPTLLVAECLDEEYRLSPEATDDCGGLVLIAPATITLPPVP